MSDCVHCNAELPEGARYCHNCGMEVYLKLGRVGGITHRDVVPHREEQQDQNQEFVRITPSLVTADPKAAALVLYGNASMQGESISLKTRSNPEVLLESNELYANITPRQVKGKMYYVALFPRIYFFTYDGEKADVTHASCVLKGLPWLLCGVRCEKREWVTLYPGLVTEVDWSRIGYKGISERYVDYRG